MAKKSRQGKGRHQPQSKKGKAMQRYAAVAAGQQGVPTESPPSEPVAKPVSSPQPGARTAPAVPGKARYTFITAELKRIGILSGIILAILIVLALVWQ